MVMPPQLNPTTPRTFQGDEPPQPWLRTLTTSGKGGISPQPLPPPVRPTGGRLPPDYGFVQPTATPGLVPPGGGRFGLGGVTPARLTPPYTNQPSTPLVDALTSRRLARGGNTGSF